MKIEEDILFRYCEEYIKGKTNLVAECFIVVEDGTVRFCGFTQITIFHNFYLCEINGITRRV